MTDELRLSYRYGNSCNWCKHCCTIGRTNVVNKDYVCGLKNGLPLEDGEGRSNTNTTVCDLFVKSGEVYVRYEKLVEDNGRQPFVMFS